jgi:hypothetical protein
VVANYQAPQPDNQIGITREVSALATASAMIAAVCRGLMPWHGRMSPIRQEPLVLNAIVVGVSSSART